MSDGSRGFVTRAACASLDWPIYPQRDRLFDDVGATQRVKKWASSDGSGDKDKMDWDKFASVHFWRDPSNKENFGGYKQKFGDIIDGKFYAVWHAVTVSAVEVDGGRGGLNVPEADKPGIRAQIGAYYAKARKTFNDDTIIAPWDRPGKRFAFSTLELKGFQESANGMRTFEGIASTPAPDRMGDVVEPMGAKFKLPISLLYQHDSQRPIGKITEANVTASGIRVKGVVEALPDPPSLKERLDVAWAEIKSGLVRGLSIGFNPLDMEPLNPKDPWGSQRFKSWEWLELSAVTIPANQDASITAIKSIDERLRRAAPGYSVKPPNPPPGASGTPTNRPRAGFSLPEKGNDDGFDRYATLWLA